MKTGVLALHRSPIKDVYDAGYLYFIPGRASRHELILPPNQSLSVVDLGRDGNESDDVSTVAAITRYLEAKDITPLNRPYLTHATDAGEEARRFLVSVKTEKLILEHLKGRRWTTWAWIWAESPWPSLPPNALPPCVSIAKSKAPHRQALSGSWNTRWNQC